MANSKQPSLFDDDAANESVPQRIELPDGELTLYPHWITDKQVAALFDQLEQQVPWEQSTIQMYGRPVQIPRLNAWFGDEGCDYQYSGYQLPLHPWLAPLTELRQRLHQELGITTNSVLVNLYRNGQDSVGWHSDDEPELGRDPVIASISLGGERRFSLKHRRHKSVKPLHLSLPSGSLLVMSGQTQHHWHHCLPKMQSMTEPRINLTFRQVFPGFRRSSK
ncbi:alpha-ketoglutarate-dependent dioxygenase AlkB family protein [Pseudomaricurvus albidus]|uniref:alpha-ketoglutarate-dependent dioxygenase AlkB family protein n=1 Tax=Pseudomaricurvus albidus TaxID=2842452 RepID=UPI001F1824A7|nr:alpha-ketoglutarate-dependent dioxygenase AlkB [Aestuariicella albida]